MKVVAASDIVALNILMEFVNVPLYFAPPEKSFPSPVILGAGDYNIRNIYQITGTDVEGSYWAEDNSGNLAVSLGIPEPSAFSLLAMGALGLVARRRRAA
jgi:hypothetical protein